MSTGKEDRPTKKPAQKQPVKTPTKKPVSQAKKTPAAQPRTYGVPKYAQSEEQQWGPYRISRRAYNEAKDAAQGWHKEMLAAGEGPLVGTARRAAILDNLEPYMGDWLTTGERKFPGLVEDYEPAAETGAYIPQQRGYGGGGGGGGVPTPPIPEMKIRTTSGIRRSPYWQSDDPYNQVFEPRFVVLGNQNAW